MAVVDAAVRVDVRHLDDRPLRVDAEGGEVDGLDRRGVDVDAEPRDEGGRAHAEAAVAVVEHQAAVHGSAYGVGGSWAAYQDVRPLAPWRVSEMCRWSRWRSVGEQVRRLRQPELR